MPITQIDIMALPRITYALEHSFAAMGLVLKLVGREFQKGIRANTPRGTTWNLYRLCKVLGIVQTPWTGKVSVGWLRKDFKRKQFYAAFVGEGTGIYGTKKLSRGIYPKKQVRVPLIRYQYKGKWVSSKSVRGQKPKYMLEKGYKTGLPGAMLYLIRTYYHSMSVYKNA